MSKRKNGGRTASKRQPPQARQPLLSVGIIFKNEIRCLERCLKSLQPLRETIPMEIVMADTGSTDGSREVAAKYADILFDFPWVGDFAAARNAVIDRCSGVWCLTVDSDEWLDGDVSELAEAVRSPAAREKYQTCAVVHRNYKKASLGGDYSEFWAARMFRMSTGIRYKGAIHEYFDKDYDSMLVLRHTVLHHDGYAEITSEQRVAKRKRNMDLLREELKKRPEDLRTLSECIDSSEMEDKEGYLQTALELIRGKKPGWEAYGPSIFRDAVQYAGREKRGEMEAWYEEALSLFPGSLFTRLDDVYFMFAGNVEKGRYDRAVAFGEAYLENLAGFRENSDPKGELLISTLYTATPMREHRARIYMAEAYSQLKNWQTARDMLLTVDLGPLETEDIERFYRLAAELQDKEGIDPGPVWARFGEGLAALAAEDSDLGRGAAMLEREDPAELSALLAAVEDWKELPGFALAHALGCGAAFPPPGRTMTGEELSALAARLPETPRLELACGCVRPETAQEICWADILVRSALDDLDWKKEDPERLARLARTFAEVERAYLPLRYAPSALCPENLFLLPPTHRFGFFCVRAFEAADRGDELGYVRALRQGLEACEQAKSMVEFLVEHRPEPKPAASPELLALAEQVKAVLSRFAPDDPAVAELKKTPAYQRVAGLIEGTPAPAPGPAALPLDEAFFGLLRACTTLGEQEVFARLKKGFLALPEQLQGQMTDYLNRYPLWGSFDPEAGDFGVLEEKARSLTAHAEDYIWLYGRLEDYRSKKLLYAILNNWARFDLETLNACIESCFDDYFDLDVFPCGPGEVVADLGAYIGDTAVSFVRTYGADAYRRYYCYEISPDTMEILKKNTAVLPNLVYRQKGAGESAGTMYIDVNSDASANALSGSGTAAVEVAALDEDIDEPITVLKMDIEGAEQAAIRGAARHIREDRPKMALSVYHNNEDLWKIPRMVDELCPGCRFYLRYHGGNLWPTEISLLAVPEGR